jgi:hypothetical protein
MESYKLTEGEIELIKAGCEHLAKRHARERRESLMREWVEGWMDGHLEVRIELIANAAKAGLPPETIAALMGMNTSRVTDILDNLDVYRRYVSVNP